MIPGLQVMSLARRPLLHPASMVPGLKLPDGARRTSGLSANWLEAILLQGGLRFSPNELSREGLFVHTDVVVGSCFDRFTASRAGHNLDLQQAIDPGSAPPNSMSPIQSHEGIGVSRRRRFIG